VSSILAFLQKLGENAHLRYASSDELQLALQGAQIHPSTWSTIMEGDRSVLETMMAAHSNVCCGLHAPEDEDEELAAAV